MIRIKMVKKYLAFLLLAVVCVSFVSAIDTKIDVKTVPDYEVQVAASKAGSVAFELLTPSVLKVQSDKDGNAFFLLSFVDLKYNLVVTIKKDNITVNQTRLSNLVSGENIELDFVPEWQKALRAQQASLTEINSTLSNESLIANESFVLLENQTDNNTGGNWVSSTGLFFIEKSKSIFSSNMTYYVIAILAVGVFAFAIRRKFAWPKVVREIKVRKLSELNAERSEERRKNDELKEAEKRLKEAQQEVNKLKNTGKVKELEERIKEQQEELKRLKDSDD